MSLSRTPEGKTTTKLITLVPGSVKLVLNDACSREGVILPRSADHKYCSSTCMHPLCGIEGLEEIVKSWPLFGGI